MLEALTASGVKSPNGRAIDRVVEQVRSETRRKRLEPPPAVWKDPFADDPERPIPVRPAAPPWAKARGLRVLRRNQARMNAENALAEAEEAERRAAAALEQANRARAVAAEARAVAIAARGRAQVAEREAQLAEGLFVGPPSPARRKILTRADQRTRAAHGHAIDATFTRTTRKAVATGSVSRGFDESARAASHPPPPPTAAPPPSYDELAKVHSSGILVVPITH